ncbi:unnamed protein product [Paramecium pentaurelia]|uniref:Uncharacterized protein n=1 Tax=Paramecium pentaurelia TaxID=43138 RepID=A0A8S1Y783_9CILI|nr:unnamed protein product [Paramecium pentaurelia]
MFNPQLDFLQNNFQTRDVQRSAPLIMICYNSKTGLPVQLKQVQYTVNIQPGLAVVEINQMYSTEQQMDQYELEYLFTIDHNSAVTKMIVELGDKKLYGIVKELEEAKQDYKKGIQAGKTMIFCEEDQKIPNIKKVKIGCLNPGKSLKIQFEYIQPLKVFLNQFWKLELQPMIDTNYLAINELQNTDDGYAELFSFIQENVYISTMKLNYKQNISIVINMGKPITYVKSPTHSILFHSKINMKEKQVSLQYPQDQLNISLDIDDPENFKPNKRFELLFSSQHINDPCAILSHTNNDALQHIKYCATLTLIPKFNEFPIDDAYQSYINGLNLPQQTQIQRGIFLFFIDRSRSMRRKRIKRAKQALILFLKSLPEDCLFNIISFGSQVKKMFDQAQTYNQTTLDYAINQVKEMDADLRGTDIYNALEQGIYDENYLKNKHSPEILNAFLLTDGKDSPEEIIQLVSQNKRPETRIYTLGIGKGSCDYLVQRIAEVGNGKCQLVRHKDDMNLKVIDLLEDSLNSYLMGFSLIHNIDQVSQIIPDPKSITYLKKNQELTLQILFSNKHKKDNLEFKINCYDPQMNKQITFDVKMNLKSSKENEYFHKIAAQRLIIYYENSISQNAKQMDMILINQKTLTEMDIINLSIQNQILCSSTAFICEVCQNEKKLKALIKKKLIIRKRVENISETKFQLQDYCVDMINQPLDMVIPIMNQENNENGRNSEELMLDPIRLIKVKEEDQNNLIISSQFLDQYNKQQKKFLPKQSIQCVLQPKILYEDQNILSYQDLIECVQANGSFLIEIHIEEQLKLYKINNKYKLEDSCWATVISLFYLEIFCQDLKRCWQLIYNKAIYYLQKKGLNYQNIKIECIQNYQNLFLNDKI